MITVPREQMPQIAAGDLPRLLVYLGNLGVSFTAGYLDMAQLQTHQDVNWEHARALLSDEEKLFAPVLVTADDVVIDGNHRYAAHVLAQQRRIGAIKIGSAFVQALDLLTDFPRTHESKAA